MGTRRKYKLIDVFRLFCAFLIILIHMGFGNEMAFIPCVTRQAVPFFFLVSGFFFEKKARNSNNILCFGYSYAIPIFVIYMIWTALWLPYIIQTTLIQHSGRHYLYILTVVLRRIILAGISPYWYLLVLAESSLILAIILHYRKHCIGWLLCVGGIVLNLIYQQSFTTGPGMWINKIFYIVFSWDCNVIMSGFPFVFFGAFISRHEDLYCSLNRKILLLLYFIVIIIAFFVHGFSSNLFGLPFCQIEAFLLFFVCINSFYQNIGISDTVCYYSRNLSSIIFCTHTLFLIILGNVLHIWVSWLRFFLTVIFGVIVLLVIEKVNCKLLSKLLMIKTEEKNKD